MLKPESGGGACVFEIISHRLTHFFLLWSSCWLLRSVLPDGFAVARGDLFPRDCLQCRLVGFGSSNCSNVPRYLQTVKPSEPIWICCTCIFLKISQSYQNWFCGVFVRSCENCTISFCHIYIIYIYILYIYKYVCVCIILIPVMDDHPMHFAGIVARDLGRPITDAASKAWPLTWLSVSFHHLDCFCWARDETRCDLWSFVVSPRRRTCPVTYLGHRSRNHTRFQHPAMFWQVLMGQGFSAEFCCSRSGGVWGGAFALRLGLKWMEACRQSRRRWDNVRYKSRLARLKQLKGLLTLGCPVAAACSWEMLNPKGCWD